MNSNGYVYFWRMKILNECQWSRGSMEQRRTTDDIADCAPIAVGVEQDALGHLPIYAGPA